MKPGRCWIGPASWLILQVGALSNGPTPGPTRISPKRQRRRCGASRTRSENIVEARRRVVGAFPGAQLTKTRPAVVLSTEDYHRHRPDVVVGLITTQVPTPLAPADCAFLDWKQA